MLAGVQCHQALTNISLQSLLDCTGRAVSLCMEACPGTVTIASPGTADRAAVMGVFYLVTNKVDPCTVIRALTKANAAMTHMGKRPC
jgi:hypothetical protein